MEETKRKIKDIVEIILKPNAIEEVLALSRELGIDTAFPYKSDHYAVLNWDLTFAFLVSALRECQYSRMQEHELLLDEFIDAVSRQQVYEVQLGNYVRSSVEIEILKRTVGIQVPLFSRFTSTRIILSKLSLGILPFRLKGMLQAYDSTREACGLICATGHRICQTSNALGLCVAVLFLNRIIPDDEDEKYIEPLGSIIHEKTYAIRRVLGFSDSINFDDASYDDEDDDLDEDEDKSV